MAGAAMASEIFRGEHGDIVPYTKWNITFVRTFPACLQRTCREETMNCLEICDTLAPYYDGRAPFACAGGKPTAPSPKPAPGRDQFVPGTISETVRSKPVAGLAKPR